MTYTPEQIEKQIDLISEQLREAIFSTKNFEILKTIRESYKLSEEQAGEMGSEGGLVLMGLTKPENFVANLQERLKINPQLAREIGQKINEQIFRPVKDEILRLNNPAPVNALHSDIAIPPAQKLPPAPPRPRPLDAELQKDVGLRPPPPPPASRSTRPPLDAELSGILKRPPTPPAPGVLSDIPVKPQSEGGKGSGIPIPPPAPFAPPHPGPILRDERNQDYVMPPPKPETPPAITRPKPLFTPPLPPERSEIPNFKLRQSLPGTPPSLPGERETLPSAWTQAPAPGLREFQKPTGSALDAPGFNPKTPTPPTSPRKYVNPFAEPAPENEENLSREEILRGIENPGSILETSQGFKAPLKEPPKQYGSDPYREPLQ